MADVAVHISQQDPFQSSKPILNGQFTAEHKIGELTAERKKRKAAEKEASRWRKRAAELGQLSKRAAELQVQVEHLQLEQQQQRQQAAQSIKAPSKADAAGDRTSDEQCVAHMVALVMTRVTAKEEARAQVAEEVRLLSERARREARMEDAIARARARLEAEERSSWARFAEQAALAAGCVGLGALGAYTTIRMVQSSGSAPSDHNWRTGTDTASLTRAAVASSTTPMDVILQSAAPSQDAYQLGSLISTADVLEQRAGAPSAAVLAAPAESGMAAAVEAKSVGQSSGTQRASVHAAADALVQRMGRRVEGMPVGSPFGVVAASSMKEGGPTAGSFLRGMCSLLGRCW